MVNNNDLCLSTQVAGRVFRRRANVSLIYWREHLFDTRLGVVIYSWPSKVTRVNPYEISLNLLKTNLLPDILINFPMGVLGCTLETDYEVYEKIGLKGA